MNSFKILIVDDNRANLRILGATFEDDGFVVHTVSSVEEAKVVLKSKLDDLDLVLSDIQMPEQSGFDLLKWMKNERNAIKDIPVLLITSQFPTTENRILGLSLGAVDYVLRSLDTQELVLRVTHAIESFKKIKNLRRSLETTECLASTGRIFAASNHEIKNVSQFISIATGILARELDPQRVEVSDVCLQALTMLQRSSSLLSEVTKMIGGIVSNAPTEFSLVDVNALLDHVVSMVKPLLKSEIDIVFVPVASSVLVLGSSTFLKQILINLILNARDAIDEGKTDDRGKIVITVSPLNDNQIELKVRDNGVGFPNLGPREHFEPFASTKQLRGGTGLGLWLSSHLAEKMGGSICLQSQGLGQGAVATMTLKKGKS